MNNYDDALHDIFMLYEDDQSLDQDNKKNKEKILNELDKNRSIISSLTKTKLSDLGKDLNKYIKTDKSKIQSFDKNEKILKLIPQSIKDQKENIQDSFTKSILEKYPDIKNITLSEFTKKGFVMNLLSYSVNKYRNQSKLKSEYTGSNNTRIDHYEDKSVMTYLLILFILSILKLSGVSDTILLILSGLVAIYIFNSTLFSFGSEVSFYVKILLLTIFALIFSAYNSALLIFFGFGGSIFLVYRLLDYFNIKDLEHVKKYRIIFQILIFFITVISFSMISIENPFSSGH